MESSSSYSYQVFNQYFDAINLIKYMSTYISTYIARLILYTEKLIWLALFIAKSKGSYDIIYVQD